MAAGLVAALAAAPHAAADSTPPQDLYVGKTACSDSGTGTKAQPFCTVQKAADVVQAGQTVRVGRGVYTERVTITRSGTPDAPIVFEADAPPRPQSGSLYTIRPTDTSTGTTVTVSGAHDVRVSGLGLEYRTGDAVEVLGSHDISFDTDFMSFTGASTPQPRRGAGVRVDGGSSQVTLTRSEVTYGNGSGVRTESGARGVVLASSLVTSIWNGPDPAIWDGTDPAVTADGVAGLTATGNTIRASACGPAVSLGGASTAALENNVLWSGAPAGTPPCTVPPLFTVAPTATVAADWNAFAHSGPRSDYAWGGTDYATAADLAAALPGQAGHDLDVSISDVVAAPPEGSPLIDSGDSTAAALTDKDYAGGPRTAQDPNVPDTGAGPRPVDRGAYERHSRLTVAPVYDPALLTGAAPMAATVTAHATDSWSETVTGRVDFGDGSDPVPLTDGAASHVYTAPGRFTETLTVTNADGVTATKTQPVTVATAAPPRVTLTAAPVTFDKPQPMIAPGDIAFTVSAGADTWELKSGVLSFGDGSTTGLATSSPTDHSYLKAGTYTATLTATDVAGRTVTASATITVGDAYSPFGPERVHDSRSSGRIDTVPAHGTVKLSLADLDADYVAVHGVQITATVTNPKATGFLIVYPDGTARPDVSTLNFTAGKTVANTLVAPAGANGVVDFYNSSGGPIDLVVDNYGLQSGTLDWTGALGDTYTPVSPLRVLDTRAGTGAPKAPVAKNGTLTLAVGGRGGVPADATAAVVNVTTTNIKATGFLSVYPPNGPYPPGTSASNWVAGQTVSNLVVVPLSKGSFVLQNSGGGTVDFVADLVGYYNNYGTASLVVPTPPTRVLDTRDGTGTGTVAHLGANQSLALQIAGRNGVPATGATAAELNITVTNDSAGGYISAYPDGVARPNASTLSFAPHQIVANASITALGTDGAIRLYNHSNAPVDLVIDQSGYFYAYSGLS